MLVVQFPNSIHPPLRLALLCRVAALQSEGPWGSWGYSLWCSRRPAGLQCAGALGMQKPWGPGAQMETGRGKFFHSGRGDGADSEKPRGENTLRGGCQI